MARQSSAKKPRLIALIEGGDTVAQAAAVCNVNIHTARSWWWRHNNPDKVYEKDGRAHKARVARDTGATPKPKRKRPAPRVVELPAPETHPADVLSVQALREEIAAAAELCSATRDAQSFQAAVSAQKHLRNLREKLETLQNAMKNQAIESTEGAARDVIRMLSADQDLRRAGLDHFHR